MQSEKVIIEKNFSYAKVDDYLFSSFLEHLGRAIYTGIYEPEHPTANEQGFRMDVIRLIQDLRVTSVRYPGGNFLSGYNWIDGIGPRETRPRRLDLAWKTIESNQFGIHEFYEWSKAAGTQIMGAVNMGTGTPQDAAYLVEYCNFRAGTYWSDLRARNGNKDPFNIKLWCVGNEMDGPWQICGLTSQEYGQKALQTIKMMRAVDESLKFVVCGSATSTMPTFPEWDRIVLEHTYEDADYLSLHMYYENFGNDFDFLASFVDMDRFIKSVASTADYVKALKRSKKTMNLSFDEWNVWYQQKQIRRDWIEAPDILEDQYSLLDALVFGGLGITLLNNADRVKIACLAQLVNVIAPIFTQKNGKAIRQSIYYPFYDISHYGRGTVLKPVCKFRTVETKHGDAPVLAMSVIHDEENGEVNIFILNIDDANDIKVEFDVRSFGKSQIIEHKCLDGADTQAKNTFENENAVLPRLIAQTKEARDNFEIVIPRRSWDLIRMKVMQ